MKRICLFLILCLVLGGCGLTEFPLPTQPPTAATAPPETAEVTLPPATVPPTTLPAETAPLHSPLYIPGLSVEDVILYFNEVCLDAEFVNSGNPSIVQKWDTPIYYRIHGSCTQEDLAVLEDFLGWLNTIEGFPGFVPSEEDYQTDLDIYFCTEQEMLDLLGDNYYGCDGGVTFWYDGNNVIYDGIICCRTDLDQYVRNSVILEEIFNGLGPVQDTWLREDSIAYAGYSTPQALSQIDQLILKLLYHPRIQPGMNAKECEAVIRQLYY